MKKRNKILYWIATIFLAFGMLAGGVQQMLQIGGYVDITRQLGYPLYLLSILGVWKILGVVAVLIPKFPLMKEWAYAGFFFVMSGAAISHIAMGQSVNELFPSLVLLIVTVLSWYFRPVDRKIPALPAGRNSVNQ
ncbi:MAG: DoxX family protein [Chitinophagaceae bacterium]